MAGTVVCSHYGSRQRVPDHGQCSKNHSKDGPDSEYRPRYIFRREGPCTASDSPSPCSRTCSKKKPIGEVQGSRQNSLDGFDTSCGTLGGGEDFGELA